MTEPSKAEKRWILNYLAFFWLAVTVFPACFVGLYYVNPVVFEQYQNWKCFNEYFMCYGVSLLIINWLLIRFTKISTPHGDISQKNSENNGFCEICIKPKPPRAHHCGLCKICVLKHDHHCFFAGKCIGHANQRYFVVFTFWLCLGAFYSWLVGVAYTMTPEWTNVDWIDFLVAPITFVRWILGYLTTYQICIIALLHSGLVAIYGAAFLCISQLYLICRGMTSFEKRKGLQSPVTDFPVSTLLRMTFGPYWLLNFIAPMGVLRSFAPLGDGTCWNLNWHDHNA